MDYPGWTVETTHPTDEADPLYCAQCSEMIAPAIAFAADWGSTAHSSQMTDAQGSNHTVVVRQI